MYGEVFWRRRESADFRRAKLRRDFIEQSGKTEVRFAISTGPHNPAYKDFPHGTRRFRGQRSLADASCSPEDDWLFLIWRKLFF